MAPTDTYKKAEVDPILQETMEATQALLADNQKQAQEIEGYKAKIAELQKAAGEESQVNLEKVAGDGSKVDSTLVDSLVGQLVDMGFVEGTKSAREELVDHIKADPATHALKLASRVITLSAPAPDSGFGVEKSASENGDTHKPGDWEEWV